eukprot:COSAG06_NODE_25605_length_632_cov_42.180113_1_plen_64_part_00
MSIDKHFALPMKTTDGAEQIAEIFYVDYRRRAAEIQEFETVDALVAEIYADIVEDFEMGNFGE